MVVDIRSALSEIEAGMEALGRPTPTLLNPGMDADAAAALLLARGLYPEPDVLTVWGWRNGTKASQETVLGDMWLVPGFYLASAEEATENIDAFLDHPRWTRTWLPLLANGGGDFLVVDCGGGVQQGATYHFRIDEQEHPLEYRTVERMMATFAVGFRRGAFYIDADGWLEEDSHAYAEIAAELNPDVQWWTEPVT